MNTITLLSSARPVPTSATAHDDEHREPMGLSETDRCHECGGPVLRTDTPGLCWACMPCSTRVAA